MIPDRHLHALRVIYEKLRDQGFAWAVTGSMGFALHGMRRNIDDIDIQTTEEGAYRIEDLFRSAIRRNVQWIESDRIRSHFGELALDGVSVEIMGAIQKRLPSGIWEPAVDVSEHLVFVHHEQMKIPVLSLQYEETAYRELGRDSQADQIRQWLSAR